MRARLLISLVLLVFGVAELYAQAPPPASNPPGAPIDPLVGLLLVAGAGYSIRRFKKES